MTPLAKKVFELFGKPELVAEAESKPVGEQSTLSLPWPCPECGGQVRLEPADDNVPSRFWTCVKCGAWGATRDGATYPVAWVGKVTVQ